MADSTASTASMTVMSDLHRTMEFDAALAWFNGILSGDDWATRDCIEVVADDGHRIVHYTVWGSRWCLEVDVEEASILGGVTVSARVKDPAFGYDLPELTRLARALLP